MKTQLLRAFAATFVLVCSPFVQTTFAQSITTFTNFNDFDEAVDITATEDFELGIGDIALASLLQPGATNPFSTFTVTDSPDTLDQFGGTGQILSDPADNTFSSAFQNNDGVLSFLFQNDGANPDRFALNFDVPNTRAFGLDLTNISDEGGNFDHNTVQILTFVDGSTFSFNPDGDLNTSGDGAADFSDLDNDGFFGIISDSAIASYEVILVNSTGTEGFELDDFTFGNPAAVPEPGSLSLLGLLVSLGFIRRKRSA